MESDKRDENGDRDNKGRFTAGNPGGGRPKRLEEITVPIGEWTPDLLKRLHSIAMTGEHKDSVPAIKLMLAYRYGNPATVITGEDGATVRIGVVMMPPDSDA